MSKSKLCVKQTYLPRIISNIRKNKNEVWKTVKLTSFQKTRTAIRFNLLHICPSVCPFVFTLLFISSYHVLNSYLYVSISLVAVLAVWSVMNFQIKLPQHALSCYLAGAWYCLHFTIDLFTRAGLVTTLTARRRRSGTSGVLCLTKLSKVWYRLLAYFGHPLMKIVVIQKTPIRKQTTYG